MPAIPGLREKAAKILYDTELVVRGSRHRFFQHQIGAPERTNVTGHLGDTSFVLTGVGMSCVGLPHAEEKIALDHLFVQVFVGDLPKITIPGSLCAVSVESADKFFGLVNWSPGYVLLWPFTIAERQHFHAEVFSDRNLFPHEVTVRLMFFGMLSWRS